MNSGETSKKLINKGEERAGKLFIFNHINFNENLNLGERKGTEFDVLALQNAFSHFNVTNKVFEDLLVKDIDKKFKEISNEDFSKNSCIVVAFLSHGYQNNMLAAKDDYYYNFYDMLSKISTNITLKSKPKIILIQACRGHINLLSLRGYIPDGTNNAIQNRNYYCDELYILHSTTETITAFRHEDRGSLFIQAFCRLLKQYGSEKSVRDIFDKVMEEVQCNSEYCQLPQISINTNNSYVFGEYCIKNVPSTSKSSEQILEQNIRQEQTPFYEDPEFITNLYSSYIDNYVD